MQRLNNAVHRSGRHRRLRRGCRRWWGWEVVCLLSVCLAAAGAPTSGNHTQTDRPRVAWRRRTCSMMELNVSARGQLNTANQKRAIPLSLHQAPRASIAFHSYCQELPVVRRKKHLIAKPSRPLKTELFTADIFAAMVGGGDKMPTVGTLDKPESLDQLLREDRGDDCTSCRVIGKPLLSSKTCSGSESSRIAMLMRLFPKRNRRRRIPRSRSIQLPLRHGPRRKATRGDSQVGIQVRHGKPQAGRRQHLHRPSLPWPVEAIQIEDGRMKGMKKEGIEIMSKKIATQTIRPGASAADGLIAMREPMIPADEAWRHSADGLRRADLRPGRHS